MAGVLGAGSILAACGGEAAPAAPAAKAEPTKAPVASAPTAAPAATIAATKPAATAVPAPAAAKGKVVFMTQGTDPADEARYKPLGELFNDKKGSVTVDIIQGDAGGGAVNAQAKLIALVASGTAPDVFWTHAYISPNLQKLNLLADISPYLASDKDVKLTDFFEAATKDYNVGGKQYGLPREATTTNLVYNKELFAKNGVSLPDESWTWETYLDAAKKMTGGSPTLSTSRRFTRSVIPSLARTWQKPGTPAELAWCRQSRSTQTSARRPSSGTSLQSPRASHASRARHRRAIA
ncbi:MAG: extracellular solute-binding protein [Chloroflexi bacterium]|nr:extracellular solute-binding protein [Chloroflexota bacterium]